jgi:hypothetical protein
LNVRVSLAGWYEYRNALIANSAIAASNRHISALNFKHSPPISNFPMFRLDFKVIITKVILAFWQIIVKGDREYWKQTINVNC